MQAARRGLVLIAERLEAMNVDGVVAAAPQFETLEVPSTGSELVDAIAPLWSTEKRTISPVRRLVTDGERSNRGSTVKSSGLRVLPAAVATETRMKKTLLSACFDRLRNDAFAAHTDECLKKMGPPPFDEPPF